ncbi:MAG: hypothetical protein WCG93_13410 [Paludibacter sp.]
MANKFTVPDFSIIGKSIIEEAQRIGGTESVKFFKQSFVKEGFTDTSFTAWKKTTNPFAQRKTLYNNGTLMQSIRKVVDTPTRIVVESDTKYSEIHNNGGTITVTRQMKKFFWAKFYEFSGKASQNKAGNASKLTKSNRTIGGKAMYFKRMALMPVGAKIKIPKRQFMGDSKAMMTIFEKEMKKHIDISFKNHLNNK